MQNADLKLLIIDDHMLMRNIVKQSAASLGLVNVDFATNGREGWDKIQNGAYNIILADWSMPEMTGLELLKNVRSNEKYNSTAFVMISAEGEKSKIMEAMKEGATFYLTKPFSSDDFQDVLNKVITWINTKN